jgi:signal transduction histidine kinase
VARGAEESPRAAATFAFVAVLDFAFYYGLPEQKLVLRALAVLVIASNLARPLLSRTVDARRALAPGDRKKLRWFIWLNTAGRSGILGKAAFALEHRGYEFVILVTIASAFIAGSIVTLAYDKTIFYPLQVILMVPVTAASAWQLAAGQFLFSWGLFLLYQLAQLKVYRSPLLQRFKNQLDLGVSLVHASKLSGLGEMARGLSHEVNSSLQVILTTTQQVQRELRKTYSGALEDRPEQAARAVLKIKSVIDGFKYFSLEMAPTDKEAVPLEEIVSHALVYTRELLGAHNVDSGSRRPQVPADARSL